MRDTPRKPRPTSRATRRTTSARPKPRYPAGRRPPAKSDAAPYILGGALAICGIVVVVMIGSKILGGPGPKIDQFASPRQTAHTIDRRPAGGVVDNSYFSQGFPSEAEDLYKEGHRILNEAMAAGRDQEKLKAAIDKLDTAVDEYFLLEKKHPDDPRIKKRIVLINKLRRLAMKSRTF